MLHILCCGFTIEIRRVMMDRSPVQKKTCIFFNPHGKIIPKNLQIYPLVIQHSHGKWSIYRWFTYEKWWFSMAMLNNQCVYMFGMGGNCHCSLKDARVVSSRTSKITAQLGSKCVGPQIRAFRNASFVNMTGRFHFCPKRRDRAKDGGTPNSHVSDPDPSWYAHGLSRKRLPIPRNFGHATVATLTIQKFYWMPSAREFLLFWPCWESLWLKLDGSIPYFHISIPIGSMYAIYGNIYHQYTPNVSINIPYMDPTGYELQKSTRWKVRKYPQPFYGKNM